MKTTNLFAFFLFAIFLATSCSIDDNTIDPIDLGLRETKITAVISGAINKTYDITMPRSLEEIPDFFAQ